MLKAEKPVVFRSNLTALILNGVQAIENPLLSNRRQPLLHIADLLGIRPSPTRVVHAQMPAILRRDLAERYLDRRMDFALDVDAFACRKGGVEVGGILKFEFRSAHVRLPSSALSESGSRGRSQIGTLSAIKLPRTGKMGS